MRTTRLLTLLLTLLVLLAGCGAGEPQEGERPVQPAASSAADELQRRPATLRFHADSAEVAVPSEVRAGEPFQVALTTYGGGCIREDTTEVRVTGLVAEVTPFQLAPRAGSSMDCTLELRFNRREVRVVFPERGAATVRIIGVSQPGDSAMRIERRVNVR